MDRLTSLFFGAFVAIGLSGCTPAPVSKAQDVLTLHYLKQNIYSPVACRSKEVNSQYFVRCTSVGSRIGGLYLVSFKGDAFTIHPVNGKAMTHTQNLNVGEVAKGIDIPVVLSSF